MNRRWGLLVLLCSLLCAMGCGPPPVIVVALANVPANTKSLEALVRQGDRFAVERPSYDVSGRAQGSDFIYTFGLQPDRLTGTFEVGVAAFDASHCLLATGLGTAEIDASNPSPQLQIRLSPLDANTMAACLNTYSEAPVIVAFQQNENDPRQASIRGWNFFPGTSVQITGHGNITIKAQSFSDIAIYIDLQPIPIGSENATLIVENSSGYSVTRNIILRSLLFASNSTNLHLFDDKLEPTSMAIADVDRDGHADIIVGGIRDAVKGFIRIYYGNGRGEFSKNPATVDFADIINDLIINDLSNDLYPDIISLSAISYVYVLVNDGTGRFPSNFTLPFSFPGGKPFTLTSGQLFNAIPISIAIATTIDGFSNSGVHVFNSDPDRILTYAGALDLGNLALGDLVIADTNGDRINDIIISNTTAIQGGQYSSMAQIFINDGLGRFNYLSPIPLSPGFYNQLEFANLDDDLNLELIATGGLSVNGPAPPAIQVHKQGMDGNYSVISARIPSDKNDLSLAVNDFNRDQKNDILVSDSYSEGLGSVSVLVNNKTSQFFPEPSLRLRYQIGYGDNVVATGDFDQDGRADFVTLSRGVPKLNKPGQLQIFLNRSL